MKRDHVMLLIDGDNVSADVIEQALAWAHKHHGGPHVRRAYCTAESAVRQQALFKRLGIRPMVNLAAGKNSTDIALAVDAIDLATSERPDVMVIVSSDSDFAPLVARLREKGCLVVGIGQQGKTGDETIGVYDDYEVLEHRKPAARSKAEAEAGRGKANRRSRRPKPLPRLRCRRRSRPSSPHCRS
jgi:NYN domain